MESYITNLTDMEKDINDGMVKENKHLKQLVGTPSAI